MQLPSSPYACFSTALNPHTPFTVQFLNRTQIWLSISPAIASVFDLPTEMRLEVGSYLSAAHDLFALAVTHSHLAVIALDKFYQHADLAHPRVVHRIMSMLRCLFAEPAALERITSFSIAVVTRTIPFDGDSNWSSAHEPIKQILGVFKRDRKDWDTRPVLFANTGDDLHFLEWKKQHPYIKLDELWAFCGGDSLRMTMKISMTATAKPSSNVYARSGHATTRIFFWNN